MRSALFRWALFLSAALSSASRIFDCSASSFATHRRRRDSRLLRNRLLLRYSLLLGDRLLFRDALRRGNKRGRSCLGWNRRSGLGVGRLRKRCTGVYAFDLVRRFHLLARI